MKTKWIKNLAILAAIISPSSLYATSVTYDESINGDLGYGDSFSLGQNQNYVTGSVSSGSSVDSDGFYFTIPDNFVATFSFLSSIDSGGSPYGASFSWELRRLTTSGDCSVACMSTYAPYASHVFSIGDNVTYLVPAGDEDISSISSLSAGTYFLSEVGSASEIILSGSEPWSNYLYTMNYTAAFDVQPIPLPSTIYLFITSLIALPSFFRKKNEHKS